jgi:hypothetical protein
MSDSKISGSGGTINPNDIIMLWLEHPEMCAEASKIYKEKYREWLWMKDLESK